MTNLLHKIFFVVLTASALLTTALGQDAQRFAGVWVLDQESSSSRKGDRDSFKYYQLDLAFEGNKLVITKDFEFRNRRTNYQITLFTDKSGEKNRVPGPNGISEIASKTRWKKHAIVREYATESENIPLVRLVIHTTEKYALSENGETLIVTQSHMSDVNPGDLRTIAMGNLSSNTKLVFRRK